MTRVLCYGDSLTWGFDPASSARFPLERVWPAVLGRQLGPQVTMLVEGLNGRTTVVDSPYAPGRNGAAMLGPLLESHAPLDLVIVMLGTNDLQGPLGLSARHAASGLWTLADIAARSACGPDAGSPQVLLVAPPHIEQPKGFMGVFYENREAESRLLAPMYERITERTAASFFDAATVVRPSPIDGVHLDEGGHATLGAALAGVAAAMLGLGS